MAISGGPDIVEDGLVLHLDAAEPLCFRGEPTVNLISDPLALTSNPIPSIYESTNTRTSTLPSTNMASISPFWIKCEKTSSSNGRTAAIGVLPLTAGVDYCISYYVYSNDNRLTNLSWNTDNASVSSVVSRTYYTSNDLNNIKRVQTVFRSTSGSNSMILRVNSTDPIGTTFYLTGLQVEQKSYPTNIVYGTRGSTVATGGGLLDLTNNGNNGTINRTSVPSAAFYSGNNCGSFVFDGSNDFATLPTSSLWNFGSNDFAIEFWFYRNGNSGQYGRYLQFVNGDIYTSISIAVDGNNQNQIRTSISSNGSSWNICDVVSGTLIDNRWNHCVLTRVGNLFAFYVNLVSTNIATSSSALYYSASQVPVFGGQTSGSRYINGKIAILKIHKNKGLSANEVRQNYNATKGRFGL